MTFLLIHFQVLTCDTFELSTLEQKAVLGEFGCAEVPVDDAVRTLPISCVLPSSPYITTAHIPEIMALSPLSFVEISREAILTTFTDTMPNNKRSPQKPATHWACHYCHGKNTIGLHSVCSWGCEHRRCSLCTESYAHPEKNDAVTPVGGRKRRV